MGTVCKYRHAHLAPAAASVCLRVSTDGDLEESLKRSVRVFLCEARALRPRIPKQFARKSFTGD